MATTRDPSTSRTGRLGHGVRHPSVSAFLAHHRPLADYEVSWPHARLRLRIFDALGPLPDVVVSSVRCLVRVGGHVVLCHNAGGHRDVLPGGGREPGESWVDTACREVHEETGWLLEPDSVEQVGWLHLELLHPAPPGHPYPHPDAFQVLTVARAHRRDGDGHWTDVEGHVLSSELVPLPGATEAVGGDEASLAVLRLAGRNGLRASLGSDDCGE